MKKNLYYATVFQRRNKLNEFILNLFFSIASYPRLVMEVFMRRDMGQRYFSTATAATIAVLLAIYPMIGDFFDTLFPRVFRHGYDREESGFWSQYATWYMFLAAFVYFSYLRWQEVKRNPSVFDFGHFSLSAGYVHPFFFKLELFGYKPNIRAIETMIEPLPAFLLGLFLAVLGQSVGGLLIVCAVVYALSYMGAYQQGDHFVMDIIDEMILNQEMKKGFIGDADSSETRGVRFYMDKPTDEELRKQVSEGFFERSQETAALVY